MEVQALMSMPLLKCKKVLQSFIGILNYLSKFSPMTDKLCESLQKLTSVKTEWSFNGMYKGLYNKAKNVIRQDTCMKFYDASKLLHLKTDVSGIGLLQVRDGMHCV